MECEDLNLQLVSVSALVSELELLKILVLVMELLKILVLVMELLKILVLVMMAQLKIQKLLLVLHRR
jgi:hypothetical protein